MFKHGLFAGKRILVTGGGTGLGEVMTETYANLGATVYICGRRAGVAEDTAKRISRDTGAQVKGFGCDIRLPETCRVKVSAPLLDSLSQWLEEKNVEVVY